MNALIQMPVGLVGCTPYQGNFTTTTPAQVSSVACVLVGGSANNAATERNYIKFYDSATSPSIGAAQPLFIAGIAGSNFDSIFRMLGKKQLYFKNGLWIAVNQSFDIATGTAPTATVSVQLLYAI